MYFWDGLYAAVVFTWSEPGFCDVLNHVLLTFLHFFFCMVKVLHVRVVHVPEGHLVLRRSWRWRFRQCVVDPVNLSEH
jgi:hypothetical protein